MGFHDEVGLINAKELRKAWEMSKEFEVHMLNDLGKSVAREMAEKFSELLDWCKSHGEAGREISLVATKLEEACFFAKKAMALKKENQE